MSLRAIFVFCLSLLLLTGNTHAHHSFSASFTMDEIVREGVITQVIYKNPHYLVYMDVADDQGGTTSWMVEGQSATSYRRIGFTAETLTAGEIIRVTGRAGRDNKPMISLEEVEVLDPISGAVSRRPLTDTQDATQVNNTKVTYRDKNLADGRPNISGTWLRDRNSEDGGGFRAHGMPPYNEAGAKVQAAFDPANDPQVACEPPGLVRQSVFTPHPARIAQFDDHVLFEYEEYAGRRTVYFDDRRAEDNSPSKFGRSIARYEGDALIIETTHLSSNPTDTNGYWLSDQLTTVETYRRLDDNGNDPILELKMDINDPGFLTEPWGMYWRRHAVDNYEFIEVECYKPL